MHDTPVQGSHAYASTLISLVKILDAGQQRRKEDWMLLPAFTALRSLTVHGIRVDEKFFFDALKEMCHLTELDVCLTKFLNDEPRDVCFVDYALSHLSLKSLTLSYLRPCWDPPGLLATLSTMTQRTKIHLKGCNYSGSLKCLTQMVDLKLETYAPLHADLLNVLSNMSRLESLVLVNNGKRSCLSSSVLAQLQNLKHLTLRELAVDLNFFQALSKLPGLTELHFISRAKEYDSDAFRFQVNVLSTLRVLELRCGAAYISPLEYIFEGRLPRLREIYSRYVDGGKEERDELFSRLPCLKKIHFHEKK